MPAAEGAATALVAPPKVPANSGATDASHAPLHHRRRSNVKEAGVEVPAGARRRSDQAGLTAQTAASGGAATALAAPPELRWPRARQRSWPHRPRCPEAAVSLKPAAHHRTTAASQAYRRCSSLIEAGTEVPVGARGCGYQAGLTAQIAAAAGTATTMAAPPQLWPPRARRSRLLHPPKCGRRRRGDRARRIARGVAAAGAATALAASPELPARSGTTDVSRAPPHHRTPAIAQIYRRRPNVTEPGAQVPAGARGCPDHAGLTARAAASKGGATALAAPPKVPANSSATDSSGTPRHHRRRPNVKEPGGEVPASRRQRRHRRQPVSEPRKPAGRA